VSGDRDL